MPIWKCLDCDKTDVRAPSRMSKLRCRPCRFKLFVGETNPNFKDAASRICEQCGGQYKSYQKARRFCSRKCHRDSLPKPEQKPKCLPPKTCKDSESKQAQKPSPTPRTKKEKPKKPPRESRRHTVICVWCGKRFDKFFSSKQKYCSYSCHLESGGAWRAGLASKRAVMRYGAKKDANHNEVVDALKAEGASVIDTSGMGGGFPDLIVGYAQKTMLMEIKNPNTSYGKRGLNSNQQRWKDGWTGGPYAVVSSAEMAVAAIRSMCDPVVTIRDEEGARTVARAYG